MVTVVQCDIEYLEKEKELLGLFVAIFIDPNCSSCKIPYDRFNSMISKDLRILEINIISEIKKSNSCVDIDFMDKYSIEVVPTMIIFKDGEIKEHISGLKSKVRYKRKIECYFN